MTWPRLLESVSRAEAASLTSTVWVRSPTTNRTSTRWRALTSAANSSVVAVLNPGACTVTRYWPTRTLRNRYSPSPSVAAVSETPVWLSTSFTTARATADPDSSVTVPNTVASNWAYAEAASSSKAAMSGRVFMAQKLLLEAVGQA